MDKKLKLLSGLCTAIACVGWILVIGGCFWLVMFFTEASRVSSDYGEIQFIFFGISAVSFNFFFVGLSAVIIARLTKFIIEKEATPSLMLRCADKFFYIFAVIGILWSVFQYSIYGATIDEITTRVLYMQPALLPMLGKAMILILLGQILKRLLPVIQESKTLV